MRKVREKVTSSARFLMQNPTSYVSRKFSKEMEMERKAVSYFWRIFLDYKKEMRSRKINPGKYEEPEWQEPDFNDSYGYWHLINRTLYFH